MVCAIAVHYAAVLFVGNSIFVEIVGQLIDFPKYSAPYTELNLSGMAALTLLSYPFVFRFMSRAVRERLATLESRMVRRGCVYLLPFPIQMIWYHPTGPLIHTRSLQIGAPANDTTGPIILQWISLDRHLPLSCKLKQMPQQRVAFSPGGDQ